jgi:hypothetical protein
MTYEVGQLTLKNDTYRALREADMIGNTVEAVLERGNFMMQQWGVVGTMARLNPLNLARTVSTGATPAAQAAKQLIVPASKGAAVTGRDPLNLSVEDSK